MIWVTGFTDSRYLHWCTQNLFDCCCGITAGHRDHWL